MVVLRGAKAVILDADDNALVLRRSDTHPRYPMHEDLPGGIIEDDETVEDGLSREIAEETGIIVRPEDLKLVHTLTHKWHGKSISRLVYAVRLPVVPAIKLGWEHAEYEWQPVRSVDGVEEPYMVGLKYATEHKLWDAV